ncbi:MAG TPA: FIST N-terminal domain-containing protein [Candidatus Binatia bacterium]|nr:FIST N-terminal domain-containing protein [Candidatus Binatia bacterium]
MLYAGVGSSTHKNTQQAASEAAATALTRSGSDTADLALVFATTDHGANYGLLLRTVQATARATHVVGCSAGGILTSDGEIEGASGIAVLTVRADMFSAERFFVPQLRGRGHETGKEVAARVRPHLGADNLLVVLPDTYNFNPPAFFAGLSESVPDLPVVGGGASEDGTVGETFQLCGDTVSNDAVCGVLLSGHFHHTIGITQSCQPIGPPHTVTKSLQNLILELDGRPAFEVFAEIVPQPLREDLRRAAAFVFVGLPVDTERQHLARGEYVVRSIVGFDPRQGIVAVSDEIHEGQKMLFTLRDGNRSRDDLQLTLEAQAQAWAGPAPGFGLYFNCASRGRGLYGFPDLDISYIKQYLGDIPIIGFFTGCEIGPIQQQSILHLYSGVLVLVGEKTMH